MSVRETVNAWFGERIATGAIARDTDAYNQAFAALDDLITRLDPSDVPSAPAEPETSDPQPALAANSKAPKDKAVTTDASSTESAGA